MKEDGWMLDLFSYVNLLEGKLEILCQTLLYVDTSLCPGAGLWHHTVPSSYYLLSPGYSPSLARYTAQLKNPFEASQSILNNIFSFLTKLEVVVWEASEDF